MNEGRGVNNIGLIRQVNVVPISGYGILTMHLTISYKNKYTHITFIYLYF